MMQRTMSVTATMLVVIAGAMGGCQPKQDEKPAPAARAPAEPPKQADAAPTQTPPSDATAAAAAPPKDAPVPPEEAVKLPGADPGWPAPGAKPAMVSRTPDGAVLEDYVIGEGFPTLPGAVVTLHYVVRVKGGEMFDSTYGTKTPRTSTTTGLMPALQDAVIGMRKGGKRRVILEPRLAYGDRGLKDAKGVEIVPPGATVIFDLELVELKQTLKMPGEGAAAGAPAPGGAAPAGGGAKP